MLMIIIDILCQKYFNAEGSVVEVTFKTLDLTAKNDILNQSFAFFLFILINNLYPLFLLHCYYYVDHIKLIWLCNLADKSSHPYSLVGLLEFSENLLPTPNYVHDNA